MPLKAVLGIVEKGWGPKDDASRDVLHELRQSTWRRCSVLRQLRCGRRSDLAAASVDRRFTSGIVAVARAWTAASAQYVNRSRS